MLLRRSEFSLSSARNSAFVVLGAMLLVLVVVASALSPKKADAAPHVVTKTFNKPEAIPIPAGAVFPNCDSGPTSGAAEPYPSIRSVHAFPAGSTIRDVNLVLGGFSHTFPEESDVGGDDEATDITLTLDDEAATSLPQSGPLVSGTFKPTNLVGSHDNTELDSFPEPVAGINSNPSLTGFDEFGPNGQWNLRVADDESGDCGGLQMDGA